MALTKIRFANKKAKREQKRKAHHAQFVKEKHDMKIRNKRMRKMMVAGRREHLARKAEHIKYVKQLEGEVIANGEV